MSELSFISQLARRFPAKAPVVVGIGDDGAVVKGSSSTVVVTDMLLDEVHFRTQATAAELIGRKAIAVNLSDLAAMGCYPTAAFVSLAIPGSQADHRSLLEGIYDGISTIADQYNVCVAGGDTNAWNHPFAINVTLLGEPFANAPILRSTAKAGNILAVTGPLGGSLNHDRHLTFEPRLATSEWLANHVRPTAMMDISDGLSIDLFRMLSASGLAAELDADQIPIHSDVNHASPTDRLRAALSDGEDFELLVAVEQMPPSLPDDIALIPIGRVIKGEPGQIVLVDSNGTVPLTPTGFQHLSD